MSTLIDRARAYIAKMPRAVSGSGGHVATFNVAVALGKGFGLCDEDGLGLLREWNETHCQPRWKESELRHKIREAAKSNRPPAYLLGNLSPGGGEYLHPALGNQSLRLDPEQKRKTQARAEWPSRFRLLTEEEIQTVSGLREVPPEAVRLFARKHRVLPITPSLYGAIEGGHPCFIIHEGNFAQAMRLDGGTLDTAHGPKRKKNLYGSHGAFLGASWLGGPGVKVLLVEGAVALLEGVAAWMLAEPDEGWTIVAATSAGSRFEKDPALLERLRGRFVRILADPGDTGTRGAASWLASLEDVGCRVEVLQLPDELKDLGPLIASPERNMETLHTIFG